MKKASVNVLVKLLPILIWSMSFAQQSPISSIQKIEAVTGHYKELQYLSSEKREEHSLLDTISFPPEMYSRYAQALALAKPVYLTSSQIDFLVNEVSFPSNSSEQTRAELDFLLKLQANRTAAQTKRVMDLAHIGYWPDFNSLESHPKYAENLIDLFFELREVVGEKATAANYPFTSALLQSIMNDMRLMEFSVKYSLLRPRPYILEPRLEPLQIMGSPSFASGHTLWAYIQAYTLSELIPQKRAEFIDVAYELGMSREIMGVHYPSDEEVARQLAHRMLLLMWHTEKFQKDFIKAKDEWE